MQRNNRIIIGAIVILLIAMFSFRFDALTGAVTQKEFESTAVFELSPDFIKIEEKNIPISGTIETTGTYLWEDKKISVVEYDLKYSCYQRKPKFSIRMYDGEFTFRTSLLDYGKEYQLRVWEYPKIGERQYGKFVCGGNFNVEAEPKRNKFDNTIILE